MRGKFGMLVAAIGLLSTTSWSQEYSLVNLGTLGGDYSVGFSVNNSGQVVGRSELPTIDGTTPTHPFLYSNGAMIDLGTLGGVNGGAVGVNQKGDVTGDAETAEGVSHAFLWNGAMQNLDPENQSGGGSINATDAVVGLEGDPQAGATGVLFSGGAVEVISHAPFDSLLPRGINDSGQIVGVCLRTGFQPNRACLITGNTVKAFQPLAGNTFSEGYAINAAGDVCGVSFEGTKPTTATLWNGGSKVNLGQLPNGTHSECDGLNDFGQEVGNAIPQSGTALRAVLFDGLNGARNLNSLIAQTPSLVLTQAFGISNTGYIVVVCQYGGTHTRACLLKPNAVLILKKNIFALEQNDPGCIACEAVLDPEANSLPDTLTDRTPEQQKRVVATVDTMIVQLRLLERVGQITAAQTRLLVHQSQLVIAALSTT